MEVGEELDFPERDVVALGPKYGKDSKSVIDLLARAVVFRLVQLVLVSFGEARVLVGKTVHKLDSKANETGLALEPARIVVERDVSRGTVIVTNPLVVDEMFVAPPRST